ncbi:hypothetical protein [Streptomyces sp. CB03911]|uniref:hypothetical protein n=1 Tax=Streptomycetaceae TaxID=2062 RepID=UPI002570A5D5|nr:hypothetical protein [Streptomyces sp. CB03911]
MLSEWLTYTVLPALGCALVLTLGALVSARCARREAAGCAVLALVGVGLLLIPFFAAAAGLPAPQGNGEHVNQSAWACIVVWTAGLGVLTSAAVSLVRLKRSAHPH